MKELQLCEREKRRIASKTKKSTTNMKILEGIAKIISHVLSIFLLLQYLYDLKGNLPFSSYHIGTTSHFNHGPLECDNAIRENAIGYDIH